MKTTKEMAEVMLAFDRGEQIQFYDTIGKRWIDVINEPNWNWSLHDYRIKPETNFVPFETPAEFLAAQEQHGCEVTSKSIWNHFNCYVNAVGFVLCINNDIHMTYTLSEIFEKFIFMDSTPCGKEVEV